MQASQSEADARETPKRNMTIVFIIKIFMILKGSQYELEIDFEYSSTDVINISSLKLILSILFPN